MKIDSGVIPRALLARIEADVATARDHLERASASLEAARREIDGAVPAPTEEEVDPRTTTNWLAVKCGSCGSRMASTEFDCHWRECQRASRTKAVAS